MYAQALMRGHECVGCGVGMRDRTLLDKKDSRHVSTHFDAKKTTSKKKSRVGEAGKKTRETKKLARAKV
jgi:hypothetical protein